MKITGWAIAGIGAGLVLVIGLLMNMSYGNRHASLKAQYSAAIDGMKIDHDTMWKIIQENFEVAETERTTFAEAYEKMIKAGAGQPDQKSVSGMLLAIGLRPPQADSALYRKVQDAISAERTKFANSQKSARLIKQEHDTLRTTAPGSWFVGDEVAFEEVVITSTRTEEVFKTGKDDTSPLRGR